MNRRAFALLSLGSLAVPALAAAAAPHQDSHPSATPGGKLAATRAALRDLWIGHIFWARNVVQARFSSNTAAAEVAGNEVVANARAIAGAIEAFYGKPASESLFKLLAGHWGAISEYLDATRKGDPGAQSAANGKLLANAGEIAQFLGGANPHLPVDTLRSLLTAHGAHHVQQIRQWHDRDYASEARTWAAMKDHMLAVSDALADGIAAQFPDRFR